MPLLNFTRSVPHTPEQMLELVADVRRYPEFVPNCSEMEVFPDRDVPDDRYDARMHIRFGPISQAYTSRVDVDRQHNTITAHALDGPFSHLTSKWTFSAVPEGSQVLFEIEFKIRNPLIAAAAEPAFGAKQKQIVDAFVKRADRIYG